MMGTISSLIRVSGNAIKFATMRLLDKNIKSKGKCTSRLDNEYRISKDGVMSIGYHFASLRRCRFLITGGKLSIGDNVGLNTNCIIACHNEIKIGNNVEFGPNVCVYDHDHDFRAEGGLKARKFKTAPVIIGDRTWIGANVVILRGTQIGNDCVVGAGSIVTGNVPDNTIYTQKREKSITHIGEK